MFIQVKENKQKNLSLFKNLTVILLRLYYKLQSYIQYNYKRLPTFLFRKIYKSIHVNITVN